MRASEASVPLNMAYLPAIPDLPALKFKDLPREMPEFVIDLIRSLLESMKVCNMYMSAELEWWRAARRLDHSEMMEWWRNRATHFIKENSEVFPYSELRPTVPFKR